MSKVDRFWSHEASNIRCVRESDYDALSAELAALKADDGEAVAWQFLDHDGKWCTGSDLSNHRRNTEEAGYQIRELFAKGEKP